MHNPSNARNGDTVLVFMFWDTCLSNTVQGDPENVENIVVNYENAFLSLVMRG